MPTNPREKKEGMPLNSLLALGIRLSPSPQRKGIGVISFQRFGTSRLDSPAINNCSLIIADGLFKCEAKKYIIIYLNRLKRITGNAPKATPPDNYNCQQNWMVISVCLKVKAIVLTFLMDLVHCIFSWWALSHAHL